MTEISSQRAIQMSLGSARLYGGEKLTEDALKTGHVGNDNDVVFSMVII